MPHGSDSLGMSQTRLTSGAEPGVSQTDIFPVSIYHVISRTKNLNILIVSDQVF